MKKKKVLIIGGASILALGGFVMAGFALKAPTNSHIVFAEGEETSEVAEQEAEKTTNNFEEIWETYLLPAILSVNVGSLGAAAVSIALAIKNSKNHKKYRVEITSITNLVVAMSKQMAEYIIMLGERNQQVKDLLIALHNSEEIVQKQMALIEEEKSNFEELKKASIALINLEVELAKTNPEFVKNGVAKQIAEVRTRLLTVSK